MGNLVSSAQFCHKPKSTLKNKAQKQLGITSCPLEWLKLKGLILPWPQVDFSYIIGGNVKYQSHFNKIVQQYLIKVDVDIPYMQQSHS